MVTKYDPDLARRLNKKIELEKRLEAKRKAKGIETELDENPKVIIHDVNIKKAEEIRDEIVKRIGFGGKLVKGGVGCSDLWTNSNALFALLDYALGNAQRAGGIRDEIVEKIGFNGKLVKVGIEYSGLRTDSNALFALLDYALGNAQRAEGIRDEIVERIGFDGKLVKFGVGDSDLWTYSNAA